MFVGKEMVDSIVRQSSLFVVRIDTVCFSSEMQRHLPSMLVSTIPHLKALKLIANWIWDVDHPISLPPSRMQQFEKVLFFVG